MTFRLGLAQISNADEGDPLSVARGFCEQAQTMGVDLLVFPESLMTPFGLAPEEFVAAAQPLDGEFSAHVAALARDHGLWIVYTLNESSDDAPLPFNTAALVDSTGRGQGSYRKVHLFDSDTHTESEKMRAGDEICPILKTPFGNIALGICYDLRFPEYARELALNGCELLLYPACWVDGPFKSLQWETLLRARAIENEMFVAGVSQGKNEFLGESYVFAPNGELIARSQTNAHELVIADLDMDLIHAMRAQIPVFEHRRTDLY